MPSIRSIIFLATAVAFATPVLAQSATALPVSIEQGYLVLDAEQHELVLPLPDWIDAAAPDWADRVSTRFSENEGQAHFEVFPRGEGEAFWTRHLGARVTIMPEPNLTDIRAVVMDVYANTCRPDAIAFFQLEADNGDDIPPLGFVCGAYLDPADADQGEVTIIAFQKTNAGVAMMYEGWRGPAFDISRTESWPVSSTEVETQVGRLRHEVRLSRAD